LGRRTPKAALASSVFAWGSKVRELLVQVTGISKHYSSGETVVRAVSDLSVSIEQGDFVAVVGRSGSGKSTLMHLLGLLERPDSGRYLFDGQEVSRLSENSRAVLRNRQIGFRVGLEHRWNHRFAVSSWMPFKYNPDGSLDLYFQNESPGADKEVNWLSAPKGPFNLTMRLFAPKSDALTGKWNPPPITKLQGASNFTAQ
jgi:energy-coupling factor transporter ATP-binding protein EcfA2